MTSLYIGPGMGAGALVITLIIIGLVLISLGYLCWFWVKRFFKKKK